MNNNNSSRNVNAEVDMKIEKTNVNGKEDVVSHNKLSTNNGNEIIDGNEDVTKKKNNPQKASNQNKQSISESNSKIKKKVSNLFGNAFSKFACRAAEKNNKTSKRGGGKSTAPSSSSNNNNASSAHKINNSHSSANTQNHHEISEHKHVHVHLPHPHLPHLHLHKHEANAHDVSAEKPIHELLKMLDDAKNHSDNIIKNAYKQKDMLMQRAKAEAEKESNMVRQIIEKNFMLNEEKGEKEAEKKIEEATQLLNKQAEDVLIIDSDAVKKAVEIVTHHVVTVDISISPTAIETMTRRPNLNIFPQQSMQYNMNSPSFSSSFALHDDEYAYIMGGRAEINDDDLSFDLHDRGRSGIGRGGEQDISAEGCEGNGVFGRTACWGGGVT